MRLLLCLTVCLAAAPAVPPVQVPSAPAPPVSRGARPEASPTEGELAERLPRSDPVAFLQECLRRYEREVRGYRTTLVKRERLGGRLQPTEVIAASFREEPFSVLLDWREGARLAQRTLYVQGTNGNRLLVRPAGLARFLGIVERDAEGSEARQSSRYPITEFGLRIGMERTLRSWLAARERGALHVRYLGLQRVEEVDDRVCHVFERDRYQQPEDDGITHLTVFIDRDTGLQVGSRMTGEEGLIASYFFRDLELNPNFPADTFTRRALER